jgi:DNA repair protein RecN (Recombination protein N)
LTLEDFVIVSGARLELTRGLNVLTGETGTGKSILLDALALLLGGRGSTALVRRGARKLGVEGIFRAGEGSPALDLLAEWELPLEEDLLIIRREIQRDGANRCSINGRTVLVGQLARLGEQLAEIHGPLEYQRLLKQESLREQLDLFGDLHAQLEKVVESRATWGEVHRARNSLEDRLQRVSEQEDWLRFQLQEIESVPLAHGEREELGRRLDDMRARRSRRELLGFMEFRVNSGEGSILETLESLDDALSRAPAGSDEDSLREIQDRVGKLRTECRFLARRLQEACSDLEETTEEPEMVRIEEILSRAERLESKFRSSWEGILERADSLRDDLRILEEGRVELEALAAQEEEAARRYFDASRRLHRARRGSAPRMTKALASHLTDVGWNPNGVRMDVQWMGGDVPAPPGDDVGPAFGQDQVSWDVETNPGEGWRPLHQVVSHGELSRLNLALLSLQMDRTRPFISVFDEVDTGIGGETSRRVAEKIDALAERRQVILVTHLATLASKAHRHFRVAKEVRQGRTEALVESLDGEKRVEEIARMLAGVRRSKKALDHARELLRRETT